MTRETILVVEDEAPMRKCLAANLTVRGFAVVTAAEGRKALRLLDEVRPDLVLLDLLLPSRDALEVLRAVRDRADAPVILLSADLKALEQVRSSEQGADAYLAKPFGVDDLLDSVRAVLLTRPRRPREPLWQPAGTPLAAEL